MFQKLFRAKSSPKLQTKPQKKVIVARLPSRVFPDSRQPITTESTFGLIRLIVHEAELDSVVQGRSYFATLSIGRQTLVSKEAKAKSRYSSKLKFDSSTEFVLQKDGPTVARIAVFRQGRLDGALGNRLDCYADVDLAAYFASNGNGNGEKVGELIQGWINLLDPADAHVVVGRVRVSAEAASLADLQRQVWTKLLPLADFDGDGKLQEGELGVLLQAFGSDLTPAQLKDLWTKANPKGKPGMDVEDLSRLIAFDNSAESQFNRLIRRCPVDGADLSTGDEASNLIYVALALNEGAGVSIMKGGYLTESQAARSWMLRVTEWATQPLAGAPLTALVRLRDSDQAGGLKTGSAAAHILVYDRSKKMIVEERLSPVLTLAMRNLYQSQMGRVLMKQGLHKKLVAMSVREGEKRDSPESVKDIQSFIDSYRGQINLDEIDQPLDTFKNFNEFFYRKLKPGVRPIASPKESIVVTSAADCRLQVFCNVDEATRFWIKGKHFTIAALLAVDGKPEETSSEEESEGDEYSDSISQLEDGSNPEPPSLRPEKSEDEGYYSASGEASVDALASMHISKTNKAKNSGNSCISSYLAAGIDVSRFYGGCMAIFRLAPQDYHRFHSPVSGTVVSIKDVSGALLTVNPIAVNSLFCDVFTENKRSVMMIETEAFGPVAFVAVGATLVGSIQWTVTPGTTITKGQELGYFAFGGSTCITLFPDDCISWDVDLMANSRKSLETLVKVGERIGVKTGSRLESSDSEKATMLQRSQTVVAEHGVKPLEERKEIKRMTSRAEEVLKSVLEVEEADNFWTAGEETAPSN